MTAATMGCHDEHFVPQRLRTPTPALPQATSHKPLPEACPEPVKWIATALRRFPTLRSERLTFFGPLAARVPA